MSIQIEESSDFRFGGWSFKGLQVDMSVFAPIWADWQLFKAFRLLQPIGRTPGVNPSPPVFLNCPEPLATGAVIC